MQEKLNVKSYFFLIDLGTVLSRSSKTTVYETQKRLATQKDPTDQNVQRLLLLSNNRINPRTANNVISLLSFDKSCIYILCMVLNVI